MKLKKLLALTLTGLMLVSATGCGENNTGSNTGAATQTGSTSTDSGSSVTAEGGSIVVWTLAADLKQFAERYTEKTGVQVETVDIEPAE